MMGTWCSPHSSEVWSFHLDTDRSVLRCDCNET